MVGWVKIFLQAEQKKIDFRPETDVDTLASPVGFICLFFNLFEITCNYTTIFRTSNIIEY